MSKKTPLHEDHLAMGAKMAEFAGYDMPINYALGVVKEHEWTREKAGLFDVSHMGQAIVSGKGAAEFFSKITPSSFAKTPNGRAKYTVLTNEQGGIIDDLIITRLNDEKFFLVYNAGRKDVDVAWIKKNLPAGLTFDVLEDRALIAIQGPLAEQTLACEMDETDIPALPYMGITQADWDDVDLYISRLGYTGEDGFEISVPSDMAMSLWKALLAYDDVEAIGLAARDSLRLEMGYPLYSHDLDEQTSPVEAGLSWVIGKEHDGFIGADKILPQMGKPSRKRVGIKLDGAGIARGGAKLFAGGEQVGALTSGGFSPSLKLAIAQGYVKTEFAARGQELEVEVRGKKISATVCSMPFMAAKTKSSSMKKVS